MNFQLSTSIELNLIVKYIVLPLYLQIGCHVSEKHTSAIFSVEQGRACPIPKLNSVALVRERTIPTERPPPVGEVSD
jgi:hypothetical protein